MAQRAIENPEQLVEARKAQLRRQIAQHKRTRQRARQQLRAAAAELHRIECESLGIQVVERADH